MGAVFFVNGFLEAGKTTFIKELLSREKFAIEGRTLLIVCEEGEVEYDPLLLSRTKTDIVYMDEEADFNAENLTRLEAKHNPDRIIIEFNGLWNRKAVEFPWYWTNMTEIAVFDATTFKLYSDNLRSFLAEQVRNAVIVLFNRCDDLREELAGYSRNIKAINRGACFIFNASYGNIVLDPDETLPYDINADELFLDDEGFAVFCIDAVERCEMYIGKTVHFLARAYALKSGSDEAFVAGRYIMTCCEADMTFAGITCNYTGSASIPNKTWVSVSGDVCINFDEELGTNVPVLKVTALSEAAPAENEFITLI
ncbi:MAG: GTPase [Lachnospiraceae bacterium]|nr:GTPase [Lachnospiraceae bacterium]